MSEPDFDLLADYVGGALAGTPDEARVAALIATDPDWAAEHASLVAALAATADDLAVFAGESAEPMPDEVVSRLLAALPPAQVAAPQAPEPHAPAPHAAPHPPAPRAPAPRVAAGSRRRPRSARPAGPSRARRRSRWLTWAAPVLVLVAVAALGGLWINGSVDGLTSTTANDSGADAAAAPAPAAGAGVAIPRSASGRDYTGQTVAGGFFGGSARSLLTGPTPGPMAAQDNSTESAPTAKSGVHDRTLSRLDAPAALQVCVDAIAAANGSGPITVETADYATFDGRPAVVVFFTDGAGVRWGWAVGPDCGLAGTDELFHARVG
ncbi:hypothetical protein AB0J74_23845 [Asanoa sp. NPDC049573]|uniref:hypothetical protein n=1 Tax=Asanoa sp. NPDC049573 TaxID=3155396 RepID=UPI00341B7595